MYNTYDPFESVCLHHSVLLEDETFPCSTAFYVFIYLIMYKLTPGVKSTGSFVPVLEAIKHAALI